MAEDTLNIEKYFQELSSLIDAEREPDERYLLSLQAEVSDFVRFNNNRVRQAGQVTQIEVDIDLIAESQHAQGNLMLSGDMSRDWQPLNQLLNQLRDQREEIGPDPHLFFNTDNQGSRTLRAGHLPSATQAIGDITSAAAGMDLVGLYAAGTIYRGFTNHLGQHNWFQTDSFNFDWSCYARADKAVKARYAGAEWRRGEVDRCMEQVRKHLEFLQQPAKTLSPGRYRAYLSPAALYDIFELLGNDSFELKAQHSQTSALMQLMKGEREFSPQIHLSEHIASGFSPNFTAEGFTLPEQVELINAGKFATCLATARSAREYGLEVNSAEPYPQNLVMNGGTLAQQTIVEELGTGIYIGNLHYLNYSDRNRCRITGMTRFACFWVENGKIVAPINVMRFDDSLYDLLGNHLIGLTRERALMMDASSYRQRSTRAARLPGALVDQLTLTL